MRQCTARLDSARRCRRQALAGATVCDKHLTVERPESEPIEIDASDALQERVREAQRMVTFIQQRIAELETKAMVFGVREIIDGPRGRTTKYRGEINGWLVLLGHWHDRLVRAAAAALAADINERRTQLAEREGAQAHAGGWLEALREARRT